MRVTHASPFTRAGMLGMLGGAVLIATAPVASAQPYVDWTSPINVTVRGDTVQKTRGCDGCDDAGAVSRQVIRSGDGYAEFTVGEVDSFWVAGLSRRATTRHNEIDFAIRFNGGGWADVMENGVYQPGGDTTYVAGDVFRIAVRNGRVQYVKNGRVLRESQKPPQYPLLFDAALGTIGATIRNARIESTDNRAVSRNDVRSDRDTFRSDRDGFRSDRFDALDLNRDGIIARNEWRGPRRSFTQLDANRNGRLTLREFNRDEQMSQGVRQLPQGVGTSGQMIRVNPKLRWTDTGLFVEVGDIVSFQADGSVQLSGNPNDQAGPRGSLTNRRAVNPLVPQASAGSLIVRIGTAPPQLVGDRMTISPVPGAGRIFLGVNDDYLDDNRGEYRVTVTIERR